jgi:hypothetical protein
MHTQLTPRNTDGKHHAKISLVAYADDVTIFITSPSDIPKLQALIQCYEATTRARININKSSAVALGTWKQSNTILSIPYKDSVTILGMTVKSSVCESAITSWTNTIAKIRIQAQESHHRHISFDKQVQSVQEYLLS